MSRSQVQLDNSLYNIETEERIIYAKELGISVVCIYRRHAFPKTDLK